MMLDLRPSSADPIVVVRQDGRYLTPLNAGDDIEFDDEGGSFVRVKRARMAQLVKNTGFESHELSLTFQAMGLALYAFTFTSCIAPQSSADSPDTFQVN
jgi:hypothetical protein